MATAGPVPGRLGRDGGRRRHAAGYVRIRSGGRRSLALRQCRAHLGLPVRQGADGASGGGRHGAVEPRHQEYLRAVVDDPRMLLHPELMSYCGFQNVTINIPQAAYKAAKRNKKNLEGLVEELDVGIALAVKAHLQKRKKIEEANKKVDESDQSNLEPIMQNIKDGGIF